MCLFTFERLLRLGNIIRAATLPSGFLRKALPTEAVTALADAVSPLVAGIDAASVSSAAECGSGVLDRLICFGGEARDCFVESAAGKL